MISIRPKRFAHSAGQIAHLVGLLEIAVKAGGFGRPALLQIARGRSRAARLRHIDDGDVGAKLGQRAGRSPGRYGLRLR